MARSAPDRIDEIRELEQEMTMLRALRNKETPGRYTYDQATFFQTRKPGQIMTIDDMVAWSETAHGGKQSYLFDPPPTGGCFRWGLCDTGGEEGGNA